MGVKDLWNIVSPSSERKPLFELQGKTIAIDLSCWIVDSQSVTDNVAQPKMYLRNLFFRTAYLLMQGISPVFVLEGKAPDLKHKEIARRNDLRKGAEERKTLKKGGRTRFNTILKECELMLNLMGLKCVRGSGEAEAMCAYLNADGLADGCISQDSDCFLYGAKTVYRNFCISAQGNRSGQGGSIDEYSMVKIERLFNLGRNKMIALALLCGCDYDEGINGVGKEAALKLFKLVDDEDVLDRIKSWSTDPKFKRMETKLKDPNICTSCGHNGKLRMHVKSGCTDCGTLTKCDESYKEKRALISNELALRKKVLSMENFPNQELIDEFLVRRDKMPSSLDLQWRQPKILEFVYFMELHVCWEPEYAFAKIFSLTTRWQLRHFAHIPPEDRLRIRGTMIPLRIKKIRNVRGVASYEIVWCDKDQILEGLTMGKTSDKENDSDNNDDENLSNELTSIEPQDAVHKCYPDLAEEFENARLAKKKKPAKPRKKKASMEINDDETGKENAPTKKPAKPRKKKTLMEINDNEMETENAPKKKPVRRTRKKITEPSNRKIDEFVQKNVAQSLEESFESMTIAPKRSKVTENTEKSDFPNAIANSKKSDFEKTVKKGPAFDRILNDPGIKMNDTIGRMFDELTPEDFPSEVENDSCDMSIVIERICGQNRANHSHQNSENDEISTKFQNPQLLENFEKVRNEVDKEAELSSESDEFDIVYVPLAERIKLSKKAVSSVTDKKNEERYSLGIEDLMNDSGF